MGKDQFGENSDKSRRIPKEKIEKAKQPPAEKPKGKPEQK